MQYLTLGRIDDAHELMTDFGYDPGLFLLEMLFLSSPGRAVDEALLNEFEERRSSVSTMVKLLFRTEDRRKEDFTFEVREPEFRETRTAQTKPPGYLAAASVAVDEGNLEQAIAALHEAKRLNYIAGVPFVLTRSLILLEVAQLYDLMGEGEQAIKTLEELSDLRTMSYPAAGIVWMFGRAHLADLYRKVGRGNESDLVEEELQMLLGHADPDHPLKVRLSSRIQSAPESSPG